MPGLGLINREVWGSLPPFNTAWEDDAVILFISVSMELACPVCHSVTMSLVPEPTDRHRRMQPAMASPAPTRVGASDSWGQERLPLVKHVPGSYSAPGGPSQLLWFATSSNTYSVHSVRCTRVAVARRQRYRYGRSSRSPVKRFRRDERYLSHPPRRPRDQDHARCKHGEVNCPSPGSLTGLEEWQAICRLSVTVGFIYQTVGFG